MWLLSNQNKDVCSDTFLRDLHKRMFVDRLYRFVEFYGKKGFVLNRFVTEEVFGYEVFPYLFIVFFPILTILHLFHFFIIQSELADSVQEFYIYIYALVAAVYGYYFCCYIFEWAV